MLIAREADAILPKTRTMNMRRITMGKNWFGSRIYCATLKMSS